MNNFVVKNPDHGTDAPHYKRYSLDDIKGVRTT